jgi:endonuclease/exonuclease/phosphatase family metal-dependent hydrolase
MQLSILTYNVLYNQAFNRLSDILTQTDPDIICLQEIDTDEVNLKQIEKYGYRLADYSNSFIRFGKIYGVATFYNNKTCIFLHSTSFQLPRSIYETILVVFRFLRGGNKPRTVLKTNFKIIGSKTTIITYNTHLGVMESNQARVKRMKKIVNFIDDHKETPTVIAGDLNYQPYARKQLEDLMKSNGYLEATKTISYTMKMTTSGKLEQYNLFQRFLAKIIQKLYSNHFKLDYMFYKNLKLVSIKRIESNLSDHFPIIAKFTL